MDGANFSINSYESSTETSDAEFEKIDFITDTVLDCDLEINEDALAELADDDDATADPSTPCPETGEAYGQMISHTRVIAAFARPITFAKFRGAPACLMTFVVDFYKGSRKSWAKVARFKEATITLELRGLDPVQAPELVMFCPKEYDGPKTEVAVSKEASWSLNLNAPYAADAASLQTGSSKSESYIDSHYVHVTGTSKIASGWKHTIVEWDIEENRTLKKGIPRYMKFIMVVLNPGSKPFHVDLELAAKLGFGLKRNVSFGLRNKNKTLSVTIHPGILMKGVTNAEQLTYANLDRCIISEEDLAGSSLESYTNLQPCKTGYVTLV
ncbi:uncharacterized protein BHQ10_003674 [Talaromyces amestolkiae]|uniref:Uncharacterized protein n=1 Tax=Talaromyces amestolkiae TaxID=1196081 RepID=A0A364KVS6_TALAM|nr:uncharacterized protein BHQ10_003674 [Talaromyces amestolkiae]RAO67662.1 hypothetical protein BHQ10_003674 [Talaromyces amestolkiae]